MMPAMDDLERRAKISKTSLVLALTWLALFCGYLFGQQAHSAWGTAALALAIVGVVLLLAATILSIWRSNA
jgi:hypothetical protein